LSTDWDGAQKIPSLKTLTAIIHFYFSIEKKLLGTLQTF